MRAADAAHCQRRALKRQPNKLTEIMVSAILSTQGCCHNCLIQPRVKIVLKILSDTQVQCRSLGATWFRPLPLSLSELFCHRFKEVRESVIMWNNFPHNTFLSVLCCFHIICSSVTVTLNGREMETKEKQNLLKLTEKEEKLLKRIREECPEEDKLLALLNALHAERTLEFQIYASREQWFWVPWTTCLAGALVALTRDDPIISIGVPLVTGLTAFLLAWLRLPGLKASYNTLNMRHKWVVAITDEISENYPRIQALSFASRFDKHQHGDEQMRILDKAHEEGFAYPSKIRWLTILIWSLLISLGYLAWKF